MQSENSWHLSYDLDQKALESATVTKATIYNRVRGPWKSRGFTKLQASMYVLDDVEDAEELITEAFEELENNDVRRYIKSMVLKGPNGDEYDLLEALDKRQASRKASDEFFRGMLARLVARASSGNDGS